MSQWVLIGVVDGNVKIYDSIKIASEVENIKTWKIRKSIDNGDGVWKWGKKVYRVRTKDGKDVLCFKDTLKDSRWWFPVDGSALRKVDACGYVDVTEEYYQARDL